MYVIKKKKKIKQRRNNNKKSQNQTNLLWGEKKKKKKNHQQHRTTYIDNTKIRGMPLQSKNNRGLTRKACRFTYRSKKERRVFNSYNQTKKKKKTNFKINNRSLNLIRRWRLDRNINLNTFDCCSEHLIFAFYLRKENRVC